MNAGSILRWLSMVIPLWLFLAPALSAQYSSQVISNKAASELYDERGYLESEAVNADGSLMVQATNGNVSYSYPISRSTQAGYPLSVSLNYCGSVAFTAFKDYNLAHDETATLYSGWSRFHQNRPAWIMGVNGWAVNVIATSSQFHCDSASRAFNPAHTSFDDGDFVWVIDGFDFSNRMTDFNPVGAGQTGPYVDVIRLLREDGSLLELMNVHPQLVNDPDADTRPELYTGYYHPNAANDRSFGIVEYDSTYLSASLLTEIITRAPDGQRYPLLPRRLRYYSGDGLEYIFREHVAPFGLGAYTDMEERSGGAWGGPTVFYLEEIRGNAGTVTTFTRARHYPIYGNPLYGTEDHTRGRALVTQFAGHSISFGYNSLIIEALGRTTKVRFDTVLRSGNAESWETMPYANNGGMTAAAAAMASMAETNPQLYKSFVGYITQIIDPEDRITGFSYEPVTRVYEDLNFPQANPVVGHQQVTLKGFRLKEITEPDARYKVRYKAAQSGPIKASTTHQPTLNNVCDSVLKYGPDNTHLTTDVYGFDTTGSVASVRNVDKISGHERITYSYHDHVDLLSFTTLLPTARHTYIWRQDEVVNGDTIISSTVYKQAIPTTGGNTQIPGITTPTKYLILPTETITSINGLATSHQTFSYQGDTLRTFGGNDSLAGRHGIELTRKVTRTHRPDTLQTVLLTDTLEYRHFPQVDSTLTWIGHSWKKFPSLENFLALRAADDPLVRGKRWEDVMFSPGVAVIEVDTITEHVRIPPLFGAEAASWRSDADGIITGQVNVHETALLRNGRRALRGALLADSVLGRGRRALLRGRYDYGGRWGNHFLLGRTNANGNTTRYSYDFFWIQNDSLQFNIGTNETPEGLRLENNDSVQFETMNAGAFAMLYDKPLAERTTVRRYDAGGALLHDTLTSYRELTYHGLTSAERDANGWLDRYDYDRNGRLITMWDAGDFPRSGALDTVAYEGRERTELYGVTWHNRRDDTLQCDRVDGAVTRNYANGPVKTTLVLDTLFASLPPTVAPPCPCKDEKKETKEQREREIAATCDQDFYYPDYSEYKGYYGQLNYRMDTTSPLLAATRIDSLYLELMVSSTSGGCIHLEVKVDTLFTQTFVFNCGGQQNQNGTREKGPERSIQGVTAVPGGYLLRVNLTSIASQLRAKAPGSTVATTLRMKTVGGTITFVNGSNAEDLRPHLDVYGAFEKLSDRADYTLAYDYDNAAATTTERAKIDDPGHSANRYLDTAASARRTLNRYRLGADGKVIRTERTVREDNGTLRVDTLWQSYNGNGLKTKTTGPLDDSTITRYDGAGRPVEVIHPDSARVTTGYRHGSTASLGITGQDFYGYVLATTTTNENGICFTRYSDAFGRLRREVTDTAGLRLTTRYEYDRAGRLTSVVSPKGDTTRYWYDEFGQLRHKYHPDLGAITYAYDRLGNIRFSQNQEQSARGLMLFNQYDDLNRITLVGEAHFGSNYYDEDTVLVPDKDSISSPVLPPTGRITTMLDPNLLHTGSVTSILTANKTLWMTPQVTVPVVPPAFGFANCQLQPQISLGESDLPVGPYIRRPAQYWLSNPGIAPADTTNFEHVAQHPEFVRIAIAYDALPDEQGAIWGTFPSAAQWDALAPHGAVRNLKGHEAAVAYREQGCEPFHYAVMSYDERGRLEALLRWTENIGFDAVYYTYNSMNQITSVRVADFIRQYTTWYGYDAAGRVDSVWTYMTGPGGGLAGFFGIKHPNLSSRPDTAGAVYRYTKTGQIDSMLYPSVDLLVRYAYNRRGWLDSLTAKQGGTSLFLEALQHDAAGQVTRQQWQHGTAPRQEQIYTYDSLQRLTRWTTGEQGQTPTGTTGYRYDSLGNRLAVTQGVGSLATTTEDYSYTPGGNRLDLHNDIATFGLPVRTEYAHSRNGSTLQRIENGNLGNAWTWRKTEQFGYSYRELIKRYVRLTPGPMNTTVKEDWRYRYSAGSEREQKRMYPAQWGDTDVVYPWVYYLLGSDRRQLAVYHGQQVVNMYCPLDTGRRVYFYPAEYLTYGPAGTANLITRPDPQNPNGVHEYIVADHLGSSRLRLNDTGSIRGATDYEPYGIPLTVTGDRSRKGYIDQEQDLESGEYSLGVRGFDARLGRFLSMDALWEKHRTWSPYHYGLNNPLTYIDPSGNDTNPRSSPSGSPTSQIVKGVFGAFVGYMAIHGGIGLLLTGKGAIAGGFLITFGVPALTAGVAQIVDGIDAAIDGGPTHEIPGSVGEGVGMAARNEMGWEWAPLAFGVLETTLTAGYVTPRSVIELAPYGLTMASSSFSFADYAYAVQHRNPKDQTKAGKQNTSAGNRTSEKLKSITNFQVGIGPLPYAKP